MSNDIVERLHEYACVGAVFAVNDLCSDAAVEIERLQRWKAEAAAVLGEWEAVWQAAGRPGLLGWSKPRAMLAELGRLDDEVGLLRSALQRETALFVFERAETERLRAALLLAVGELSTYGEHRHMTPELLFRHFMDEAEQRAT